MTSARKDSLEDSSLHGLTSGLDESFSLDEFKSSVLSASQNMQLPEKSNEYLYELVQIDGINVRK